MFVSNGNGVDLCIAVHKCGAIMPHCSRYTIFVKEMTSTRCAICV